MPDAFKAIHIALVIVLGWFGLVLLFPGDTFNGSYSFDLMKSMMSETHWGVFFVVVSLFGGLCRATDNRGVLRLSSMVISTGHGFIASSFFISNVGHPLLPGPGVFAVLAILGYYLTWGYFH